MYLPLSKFESIQRLGECTLHWHYVATTIYYVMVWVIIISIEAECSHQIVAIVL